MRILDRERFWAFTKAYCICFIALVGLYVVIDAFTNIDEFSEVSESTVELFRNMGWYYLIKMSMFYDRLCGVITMMAAIFTVTWMQKNNELLAMLAAGISTRRVIRPVLVSAVIVSSFAVVNQELIMPRIAEDLQKSPDDDGVRKVMVTTRRDTRDITLSGGGMADRAFKTVINFSATIPVSVAEELLEVQADQARYIPKDANTPLKGGWLMHGARLVTPPSSEEYKKTLVRLDNLNGFPKPMTVNAAKQSVEATGPLPGEIYFLNTDLTFEAVTRNRQWYQFANTYDLILALREPYNKPEWTDIEVFLHTRMIRPLASLALLALSLPLVLGGQGRNMFVNLGMSLATSGVFYAVSFMSQYFGTSSAISPELAAWIPLIGFGTLAVARWDTIRT
jgi:lipopolysaccharide export system permease protein